MTTATHVAAAASAPQQHHAEHHQEQPAHSNAHAADAPSSSSSHASVPEAERPILLQLEQLRTCLQDLKRATPSLFGSAAIMPHTETVARLLTDLKTVRHSIDVELDHQRHQYTSAGTATVPEANAVDEALEDVLGLVFELWASSADVNGSLYPVFVKLEKIRRGLENLERSGVFTPDDVRVFQEALVELEEKHVRNSSFWTMEGELPASQAPPGQAILSSLLNRCHRIATKLLKLTEEPVDHSLYSIYTLLVDARTNLKRMQLDVDAGISFDEERLNDIKRTLANVSSHSVDGIFVGEAMRANPADGAWRQNIPKGQAVLVGFLEECYEIVSDLMSSLNEVESGPFASLYNDLIEASDLLENVLQSPLRVEASEDLAIAQALVQQVVDVTKNGTFLVPPPNIAGLSTEEQKNVQHSITFMLRKCRRLLAQALLTVEPVDTSLLHVQRQLTALRTCLRELKRVAVFSAGSDGGEEEDEDDDEEEREEGKEGKEGEEGEPKKQDDQQQQQQQQEEHQHHHQHHQQHQQDRSLRRVPSITGKNPFGNSSSSNDNKTGSKGAKITFAGNGNTNADNDDDDGYANDNDDDDDDDGPPFEPEELTIYQTRLSAIDNMRVDGKFMHNGVVPPGQAVLHALLNENYDLIAELWDMAENYASSKHQEEREEEEE